MKITDPAHHRVPFAIPTLCLGLAFALLPALSIAETRTVTKMEDDGSEGTLRKEIADAVTDDVIEFADNLDGEIITLSGTEIQITKNLTIDASMLDDGVTISGNQTSRVFSTKFGRVVTMKSLTITGGNSVGDFSQGGGLFFDGGTFDMEHCTVTGNTSLGGGGGIYSTGTLTMRYCTISHNQANDSTDNNGGGGGGIGAVGGAITLEHCTIANNQAGDTISAMSTHNGGDGGGIRGSSTIFILRQCTVVNNRAGHSTNGNGGHGGGLYTQNDTLTLEQCTFANNEAGNGGVNGGDGGGVYSQGGGNSKDIFFTDCLIAGNMAGTGTSDGDGPDFNRDNLLMRSGINLIGDNTLANGNASTVLSFGDFVGDAATPLDPLLGPLSDNGGPTETMLPLRGSPALNPTGGATVPGTFLTDQRGPGFDRIIADSMDIGAVEAPDYAAIDAANAAAAAQAAAEAAAAAQAAAEAAAAAQAAAEAAAQAAAEAAAAEKAAAEAAAAAAAEAAAEAAEVAAQAAAKAKAAAAAAAQVAATRSAQQSGLSKKIKKLKKKSKNAKRKGQAAKTKKYKKQIKKLTKQVRAL